MLCFCITIPWTNKFVGWRLKAVSQTVSLFLRCLKQDIFFGSAGRLEDSGLCALLTRWSKAVGENMENEKI